MTVSNGSPMELCPLRAHMRYEPASIPRTVGTCWRVPTLVLRRIYESCSHPAAQSRACTLLTADVVTAAGWLPACHRAALPPRFLRPEPDIPQINQQQSNSYLEACLLARDYGPFLLGHKSSPSPRARLLCPLRFWLAPACCGLLQGKQTKRLNITNCLQRNERFVFKSVYTTKHITRI